MLTQKSQNKTLKKAIFNEIREENLRLDDPHRPFVKQPAAPSIKKKSISSRFVGLFTAFVFGLTAFFIFDVQDFSLKASRRPLPAGQRYAINKTVLPPSSTQTPPLTADRIPLTTSFGELREALPWEDPMPAYAVDSKGYDFLFHHGTVRLTTLFGLGIRNIVIDPGHGGKDPGAIGEQGTLEKDITLDVALRLKRLLEKQSPFTIYLTRETDKTSSLSERVKFTNAVGADLFISIHVNSIPEPTINTIETYYFGPPSDEKTLALAERENAASMYSAGEFRHLIQKIGNTMKHQESIALATHIQRRLFANIRKYDKDVHNWGVKVAPFMVLLDVEAPAVLTEISCISEPDEEKKLNTTEYRENIASFIENGIIAYLSKKQVQAQRGDNDESKKDG